VLTNEDGAVIIKSSKEKRKENRQRKVEIHRRKSIERKVRTTRDD